MSSLNKEEENALSTKDSSRRCPIYPDVRNQSNVKAMQEGQNGNSNFKPDVSELENGRGIDTNEQTPTPVIPKRGRKISKEKKKSNASMYELALEAPPNESVSVTVEECKKKVEAEVILHPKYDQRRVGGYSASDMPRVECTDEDFATNAEKDDFGESCCAWSPRFVVRSVTHMQLPDNMRRWKTRFFTSDEARQNRKKRFDRIKYYVKVFLANLFSTAGLCSLAVGYSLLGAFTFEFLESGHELNERRRITSIRQDCAGQLWNLTYNLNVLHEKNWTTDAVSRLKAFELEIVKAVKTEGYDGYDVHQDLQWSFSGALLYSITVITTIGYGNITPKTDAGKIITIIYALVGIPIMFLCLANLGFLMANAFRFSYRQICCICCFCCKICISRPKPPSKTVKSTEDAIESEHIELKVKRLSNFQTPPGSPVASLVPPPSPAANSTSRQHNEEADRVPIWLVLLLVVGYIMGGALMFSLWEGWGLLNGAYFCFITLSTIGFGDLVPGTALLTSNKDDGSGQVNLIICCCYLILGLALISMSFSLVQDEIIIRCREIARNVGLLPQKSDESNQ